MVIALEYDPMLYAGRPDDTKLYQIHLSPETLNEYAELEIIDAVEQNRLRKEFKVPGQSSNG